MVKNIIKFNFLRSHVVNQNEIKYSIVNTHYPSLSISRTKFLAFLVLFFIFNGLVSGWFLRVSVGLLQRPHHPPPPLPRLALQDQGDSHSLVLLSL